MLEQRLREIIPKLLNILSYNVITSIMHKKVMRKEAAPLLVAVIVCIVLLSASMMPALASDPVYGPGNSIMSVICVEATEYKDYVPHYNDHFPQGSTVKIYVEAEGKTKKDDVSGDYKPSIKFTMTGTRPTGATFTASTSSSKLTNYDKTLYKETYGIISFSIGENDTIGDYRFRVEATDSNKGGELIGRTPYMHFYVDELSKVTTTVFGQDITVDELWNNTQVAIRNVKTVRYDQDTIMAVQGESLEDFSKSEVDYEAERSYTSSISSLAGHGATYIDGKNVYVYIGGDWEKQDHIYRWSMENKVEEFLGCKPPAYMNILRDEVIGGEECWVVKCWPMNPLSDLEVTATDWIAKEDYLPRKSQVRTRSTTNDIDISTTRTIYFYDYNGPRDLPDTPGFEVTFAIAGLLTVVYLIRRRNKK